MRRRSTRLVDAGYFTADATSDKPPVLDRDPAAQRQRVAAHGSRLRARSDGRAVASPPDAGLRGPVAARHGPRGDRDADDGRAQAGHRGQDARRSGPRGFIERVWTEKAEIGGNIGEQMRRLGDSVDWSRERFTMDEGLSRAVHTVFKKMFDDGLIYQAERLVNWSPVLKTAVSDIEVSYADVEGELVSFRYGSLDDSEPPHRGGHDASGDDARRHRDRRSPRRRALCAPDRHRTAAPVPRPDDPDRRRRLRRPPNSAVAR